MIPVRRPGLHWLLAPLLGLSAVTGTAVAGETRTLQVENNQGVMSYDLYLPTDYTPAGPPVPLVVALHGGNDSTAATATLSGWNILAEEYGFLVAYPQEDPDNRKLGIWRWSAVARYGRADRGASLVALITRTVIGDHAVDPNRVLITGLSAGAGMAVAVGVTFAELYAAVGAESGCAYGYANCQHPPLCGVDGCDDPEGASNIYFSGEASAQAAYEAMGEYAKRLPAIVSYGDLDGPGLLVDQDAHIEMWTALNDWTDDGEANGSVAREPAAALSGHEGDADYQRLLYQDASGCPLVERWVIAGLDHAYSGVRDEAGNTGYGPDMRRHQYQFLLRQSRARPGCEAAGAAGSGAGASDLWILAALLGLYVLRLRVARPPRDRTEQDS